MSTSRGAVSDGFALDACIDASGIWIRDNLSVPVQLSTSGDTGTPVRVDLNQDLAADVTRARYPSPLLLLPGDLIRIPVGAGAASVTLANTDAGGFYALAFTAQTFFPGGVVKNVLDAFTNLITELNDDYSQYQACVNKGSFLKREGCRGLLARNVAFAVTRAAVTGLSKSVISLLLNTDTFLKWAGSQPSAIQTILGSERTISLRGTSDSPLASMRLIVTYTAPPITLLNPVCAADPLWAHGYGDNYSVRQISPSISGWSVDTDQTGSYSITELTTDQQVVSIGAVAVHVHSGSTEAQIGFGMGVCGGPLLSPGALYEVHVGADGGSTPMSSCATVSYSRSGDTFTLDASMHNC